MKRKSGIDDRELLKLWEAGGSPSELDSAKGFLELMERAKREGVSTMTLLLKEIEEWVQKFDRIFKE
jgi:hypothetical protein